MFPRMLGGINVPANYYLCLTREWDDNNWFQSDQAEVLRINLGVTADAGDQEGVSIDVADVVFEVYVRFGAKEFPPVAEAECFILVPPFIIVVEAG